MKLTISWQSIVRKLRLLKDWKLVYKLFTFSIFTTAFVLGIIFGVFLQFWYISPNKPHIVNIPRLYNLNVLLSFWSVQSNLLVLVYFWFAIYHHGHENQYRISNVTTLINVTVYLTLTMILFWVLVFYGLGNHNPNLQKYHFASKMDETVTITTHAITPILTIFYLIIETGKYKINNKRFLIKNVMVMLIYPIAYLIFVNLRAKLLADDEMMIEFLFPYPFIDFYHPMIVNNIIINDFLIVVIGISMLTCLAGIFVTINNLSFWQKTKLVKHKPALSITNLNYH